jgi:hypothetical protein
MTTDDKRVDWSRARRAWRRRKRYVESVLASTTVSIETWWRARCWQMNPPPRPLTRKEVIAKLVAVFESSITKMINMPCALPMLLPADEGTTVRWDQ